jgi:hypothetical protein
MTDDKFKRLVGFIWRLATISSWIVLALVLWLWWETYNITH